MIKTYFQLKKQVIAVSMMLLIVLCPVFSMRTGAAEIPAGLYSTGAVLMDADSGRVLFSKAGDETFAMASTTKIMTCILALELGKPEQIVTFSKYAASMPDVQMNAKEGEQYYLRDLLYSVMLESHNDSAAAVAEAIGGSVEGFTRLMNQKAEAIGCFKTHFVTPNGLDGEDEEGEHRTTARELAMILRYCIHISAAAEEFLKITGTGFYEFQEIHGKRHVSCRNHNALLTSYEGALTGKTGFTGKAGYCYTGAVKRGEMTLIIALLGAGWYPHKSYKWKDAGKLLDYGFENYHYEMIGKDDWTLEEIHVTGGMKERVKIATDAGPFSYVLKSGEQAECKIDHAKELQAPVEMGTLIGKITYELDGKVIEQFQVFTAENVEEATLFNRLEKWIENVKIFLKDIRRNVQRT